MEEKFTLLVTNSQYSALDDIRGLAALAHTMFMCAGRTPEGWILKGSAKAFDELLSDLHTEVDERMCSKKNLSKLVQIINKIEELFPHEDIF